MHQQGLGLQSGVGRTKRRSERLGHTAACRNLGTACNPLAPHIDQSGHEIQAEIESFPEGSAGVELVGAQGSLIIFGTAEAAAQDVEVGPTAFTGTRIADPIRVLVAAARTIADTVGTVVCGIADVGGELRDILDPRISAAVATLAEHLRRSADGSGTIFVGWIERNAAEQAARESRAPMSWLRGRDGPQQ